MSTTPDPSLKPSDSPAPLPAWYPSWAKELADAYFSGTTSVFLLHGNVHDLIETRDAAGKPAYCNISEFLATQLFGKWDLVISHDLSRGLRPQAGANADRLRTMMQYLSARWGEPMNWPAEPEAILGVIEETLDRNLIAKQSDRKSIAFLFEYAQYLIPTGDLNTLARGQAARLVRFLRWAQNPHFKQVNVAFCLIADRLLEVNDRLVQNAYVSNIEVALPDREQRLRFIQSVAEGEELAKLTDFTPEELADISNGLSLVDINVVLSQATRSDRRVDSDRFRILKKDMIERQCQGLVEFVEPKHNLDLLVGYSEAKKRLREDAERICRGQLDTAPMGYLVCGPVGSGKTFLAECYAGSIGIPCVILKNFRSKYVGETEGNLQLVLTVLRSLGPVVVIVDEADAALGNRESDGDSGTSSRVFSMIASQMGNTQYRGKIIWMLLTSRPDLLPIDLKRQGRAEVHIPLFYPQTPDEIRTMFVSMGKKNKIDVEPIIVPEVSPEKRLTGADIESVLLSAKRSSLSAGRTDLTGADLKQAVDEFIPSAQGLEKELQELAAVMECTQLAFLPSVWREKVTQPDGRTKLQERLVAIRQLLKM
jgi:ATP-dependent 26S proteasome regulatory subunit